MFWLARQGGTDRGAQLRGRSHGHHPRSEPRRWRVRWCAPGRTNRRPRDPVQGRGKRARRGGSSV